MNPETAMPLKAERDGSKTTADIIVYVTNFDELENNTPSQNRSMYLIKTVITQ